MKRSPELRDLSVDHHHGLVLARTARNVAEGRKPLGLEEAWTEVAERFAAELEPHFRIEEELLAPALAAAGEGALVGRLHEEHAALRAFVGPAGPRSAADLGRFGELLEQHIRFEERVLFVVAEEKLDKAVLGAVAEACLARAVAPRCLPR